MPRRRSVGHTEDMTNLVHPSQLDPRLADLQRPAHTGFTGGLCRSLAQRWRVDPIIVRLAAIALTFAGGVGVALYAWGCLLTPRVGGQTPILRLLPAFGRWTIRTQALVVAISSLVLVLGIARQTSVSWGPVIIVGAVAWGVTRKRRRSSETDGAAAGHLAPFPGATADGSPAPGETVEQWRARVGAHGGSPLPTVDLYAPAPHPRAVSTVARDTPRTSWRAALTVVALTALGGAVPFMLGLQPVLLWAGVGATGAAAAILLVWSLVVRNRRLPGALLILALMGAAGTGALAVSQSQASTIPLDPSVGGMAQYSFIGDSSGSLDLTQLGTDTPATVTIDATASIVHVQLASPPDSITINSDTIDVTAPSRGGSSTASQLDLLIDGDFSVVELAVAP